MSRIIRPGPDLIGRAETTPDLVLYLPIVRRFVESLILHAQGIGTPRRSLWYEFAVDDQTPPNAPAIAAIDDAAEYLREQWPSLAATQDLRAYQIIGAERRSIARVNGNVRGVLTARLLNNPENPRKPNAQLQFGLLPDEPEHAGHFVVFQWNDEGHVSAIVKWDAVAIITRGSTAAHIEKMIRRSLPPGDARARWTMLVKQVPAEEIRDLYYELGVERLSSHGLASRILERLESSVRAGMPSRQSKMGWVPLDDPDPDHAVMEGEHLGLTSPVDLEGEDVRLDTERAIDQLNRRDQEIIRLHMQGHADEEIAKELGVSHQAVNKRRLKALTKLREILSG